MPIIRRHGCKVAIGSRNLDKLKVAAADLEKATGGECFVVKMDVRKVRLNSCFIICMLRLILFIFVY